MKYQNLTIGADPEIFVEHADGTLFPAFEFLPSKYEPAYTPEENQSYYWDGFQAEFNVRPSSDIGEVLQSVKYGLKSILAAARRMDPGAKLSTKTVVETPLDMLAKLPAEYTEFGCMPSYNVYSLEKECIEGHECPYRFAGGHIHFGTGALDKEEIDRLVMMLDNVLAVTCLSIFHKLENPVRRKYYGLPGEFRLPPHGIEYRTLSNAWLFHPAIAYTVLSSSQKLVQNCGMEFTRDDEIITALRENKPFRETYVKPFDHYHSLDIEKNWSIK